MKKLLSKGAILVGHSLHNDLRGKFDKRFSLLWSVFKPTARFWVYCGTSSVELIFVLLIYILMQVVCSAEAWSCQSDWHFLYLPIHGWAYAQKTFFEWFMSGTKVANVLYAKIKVLHYEKRSRSHSFGGIMLFWMQSLSCALVLVYVLKFKIFHHPGLPKKIIATFVDFWFVVYQQLLWQAVLGRAVREKGAPHNCLDDACAAMNLVLAKIKHGVDREFPISLPQERVSWHIHLQHYLVFVIMLIGG